MAIIPVVMRLAPRLGMIDQPDPRKVHVVPIPRVGGVGIVLGALVPIATWLPLDALSGAYLFGAVVLLVFGVWDDACELGHYVKFIGQFIAVVAVVYYGDLYVTHLPFMGLEAISESIGRPFTVFAMMGMINAINHSDGLDGLASGMSLLSLSAMGYLAFLADGSGPTLIIIALATVGGIFGFLRYNTHPAKVFMGDGGSQFLGFTLGFLVVFLIEKVNPVLSPALPALMLGLPVADILAVFAQRVYHGMNWFRATRNHIHHRLLELGFDHYEAVVIKYSIQTLFVVSAMFLSYESDLLILAIYIGVCALVFIAIATAEHTNWRAHSAGHESRLARAIRAMKGHDLLATAPVRFVAIALPSLFLLVSLWADKVPHDFGIVSAVLAVILFLYLVASGREDSMIRQAVIYTIAAFVVYLETKSIGNATPLLNTVEVIYFVAVAAAISFAIRYAREKQFRTTPTDYLVVFIVLFAGFLLHNTPDKADIGFMAVKLIVIFYGCELVIAHTRGRWNVINLSALASLVVLSIRGLA
jgi:UDP-GlcNAc:undecaprenyl-phosphate GlcNAc-1-phosphate transferase